QDEGELEPRRIRSEGLETGHVVVFEKSHQFGGAGVISVEVEDLLHEEKAVRILASQGGADGLTEAEVEQAHPREVGEFDGTPVVGMAVDPLAEAKQVRIDRVQVGSEFLPEPQGHMLDGVDAQSVDALL